MANINGQFTMLSTGGFSAGVIGGTSTYGVLPSPPLNDQNQVIANFKVITSGAFSQFVGKLYLLRNSIQVFP